MVHAGRPAPSSELRPPSRPVPPKHEGTGAHGPRHFSNWFDILLVLAGLADIYIIVPWACHGHLGTGRACRSCLGAHLFLNLSPSLSLRLSQTQREGLEIVPWAPMSFLYISLSDSLRLKGKVLRLKAYNISWGVFTAFDIESFFWDDRVN